MYTFPMFRVRSADRGPVSSRRSARAPLSFTVAGLSDTGRVREQNEDCFLVAPLSEPGERPFASPGYLLAVADGVGGASSGEIASALAVETIAVAGLGRIPALAGPPGPQRARILDELQDLVRLADRRVVEEAFQNPSYRGMATTLTAAALAGSTLLVAHVGDSRCCLLREGALRRLTEDQTVPAELLRRGIITREEAEDHAYANVLTDYVGGGPTRLRVQARQVDLGPGDLVLLASDGLSDLVADPEIASILAAAETPEAACAHLVARANALGGHDNVTAVVARCAIAA
jgi:protein phosphatase